MKYVALLGCLFIAGCATPGLVLTEPDPVTGEPVAVINPETGNAIVDPAASAWSQAVSTIPNPWTAAVGVLASGALALNAVLLGKKSKSDKAFEATARGINTFRETVAAMPESKVKADADKLLTESLKKAQQAAGVAQTVADKLNQIAASDAKA